jgi:CrcB protein
MMPAGIPSFREYQLRRIPVMKINSGGGTACRTQAASLRGNDGSSLTSPSPQRSGKEDGRVGWFDNRLLWISLGAVAGANARYWAGLWAADRFGVGLPYGTLLVNITGCLVLGFLITLGSGRIGLSQEVRLLIAIGFLGSYTTFSSFAVETLTLVQSGAWMRGLVNFAANNGLGLLAAWLGATLARLLG